MKKAIFLMVIMVFTTKPIMVSLFHMDQLDRMVEMQVDGNSFEHYLQLAGVPIENNIELWVSIQGQPDQFIPITTPVNQILQQGNIVTVRLMPLDDDELDQDLLQLVQNLLVLEDEGLGPDLIGPRIEDVD